MQLNKSQEFDDAWCDELDEGWDSSESDRMAAHRVALVQAYFASLGLRQPASGAAAHRVVSEVVRTLGDWNDPSVDRQLVAVARKWIRDFSESYRFAPGLLSKFPSAFLETSVPSSPH
jgi:hypothetical protein